MLGHWDDRLREEGYDDAIDKQPSIISLTSIAVSMRLTHRKRTPSDKSLRILDILLRQIGVSSLVRYKSVSRGVTITLETLVLSFDPLKVNASYIPPFIHRIVFSAS